MARRNCCHTAVLAHREAMAHAEDAETYSERSVMRHSALCQPLPLLLAPPARGEGRHTDLDHFLRQWGC